MDSEPSARHEIVDSSSNETLTRLTYLHDLIVYRKPKTVENVDIPDLASLVSIVCKLVEHKPIIFSYQRDQGCVALLDARIVNDEFVAFLFGCGDDRLTLKDLINKQTGEHMALNVPNDHVNVFSAHLLVRLKSASISPHIYPCLIEKVLGAPKTLMLRLLNRLLHDRLVGEIYNEKGNPIKSWPGFSIVGHPSKFFNRRDNRSTIRGVVLTKLISLQDLPDDFPQIRQVEEKISLKINPVPYNEDGQNIVKKILAYANRRNFTHVRVRVEDPTRGQYETEPYDPAADAQEFLTIHHEPITISSLNHFDPKIRQDVLDRMIDVLNRVSSKWD